MSLLVALLALWPAAVLAAGDAHHDGHTTAGQWLGLVFAFINFAVFVFLIRRYAAAPLRDYLIGRRKRLVEELAAAARAKEEAERVKKEYEAKAARLDEERAALLDEMRANAQADSERLLAAVEQAGERLRRDAERTAQSDLERARRELRTEAARLAAEVASARIGQRMTEEQRERLLKEFLDEVDNQK